MDTVPSTPDPQMATLVAAVIRAALQIASGLGFAVGAYSDSTITMIATAVVGLGTAVWSLWQKYQAAKVAHEAAVTSAATGAAVKPAA